MVRSSLFPARSFALAILAIALVLAIGPAEPATAQSSFTWYETGGPEGGDIWALAEAPNGDLYAGTWWGGGIYRSRDGGNSWTEVGLQGLTIHHIVVTNAGWVLVGSSSSGSVYRSKDDGDSWHLIRNSLVGNKGALAYDAGSDLLYAVDSSEMVRSPDGGDNWDLVNDMLSVAPTSLVALPSGGPMLLATEQDKVFRSVDGGENWDPFDAGITVPQVTKLIATPGDILYASTWGGGVYRASVLGMQWTPLAAEDDLSFCVSLAYDDDDRLWVGSMDSGVFMSDDDGATWNRTNAGMESLDVRSLLAVGTDEILAGTTGGVFHTDDAGANWATVNDGLYNTSVMDFALADDGTVYAATWGSGIFRSTDDGATWIAGNIGIEDFQVRAIAVHPDGDLFAGGWRSHVYRSQDGGLSWNRVDSGMSISRVGCIEVNAAGDVFVGGFFSGGVWRSPDKGDNWTSVSTDLTEDNIWDLFFEPNGDLLAATYGGGVFRSPDDGDSWTPISNGLTELNTQAVVSLGTGTLFVATAGGGVFRSSDDGQSWHEMVDIVESWVDEVTSNRMGHVFVTSSSGRVYRSADEGDSWQVISDGLPFEVGMRCISFTAGGRVLLGSNGRGVIVSEQSTPVLLSSFTALRAGPGEVILRWSAYSQPFDATFEVFRGERGSGSVSERMRLGEGRWEQEPVFVFRDTAAPTGECEYWLRSREADGTETWFGPTRVAAAVLGARLASIQPNPLSSVSLVRFSLPGQSHYDLSVYDLSGRRVRRLAGGPDTGGVREIEWNGRDESGGRVAAGTYVVRLEAGGRVDTRKVVVLQ